MERSPLLINAKFSDTNTTLRITMKATDTVAALKEKIYELTHMLPKNQRHKFDGREVEDYIRLDSERF